MRTRSLLLLLVPLLAVAAPVPKQTEKDKIEAKFGKIVDPKGDSKFALDGDALKITLPADATRFVSMDTSGRPPGPAKRVDDTPKVEFSRTGDFVLVVRIGSALGEGSKAAKGTETSFAGGGVAVTAKDGTGWHMGMLLRGENSKPRVVFNFGSPNGGSGRLTGTYDDSLQGNRNWLRVTRTGAALTFDASADGENWTAHHTYAKATDEEMLTVSVFAQHGSDKSHTVTFDQFSVEKPKAEKK